MLKALPPLTLFTAFMLAAYMYPIPAAAKTIRISLGSVVFTPDTVTAAVGDVLEFSFFPVNNSATMSDFDNPCTPAKDATGFHSGFFATASGQNVRTFFFFFNLHTLLTHLDQHNSHIPSHPIPSHRTKKKKTQRKPPSKSR